MTVCVKFFAGLREQLGCGEIELEFSDGLTVADVWSKVTSGRQMPANTLIAVNFEYAKSDVQLRDGDEVGFFPPVTGG